MRGMQNAQVAGRLAPGIAIAFAMVLSCPPALALNPALDLSQYAHTSWKLRDGLASAFIRSIAQTPDGYLWLATEFGLLRFDGVRSTGWQPPPGQRLPSTEIYRVLAARDGSLWIATASGLARWKDGKLIEVEQLAGEIVMTLIESRDGTIWAGTIAIGKAKICKIERSAVQCDGGGRLGNVVARLHEDSSGRIWAAAVNGMWQWTPGPPRFHPVAGARDAIRSVVDDEGGLLVGGLHGIRRLTDGRTDAYAIPGIGSQFAARAMLRDRDGGLWIGTADRGLVHVHHGRSNVFGLTQGLSSDRIETLFEDREGNIWVATANGLDRFRDVAIPTFGARQGVADAPVAPVLVAGDASIWFGANGALNRRKGSSTIVPTASGKPGGKPIAVPTSALLDHRGRVWVSTLDGSGYFENGRYISQPGVPGGAVHAMAEDARGSIWIANQRHGLLEVSAEGNTRHIPWATFGRKDFATALVADPAHRGLWMGFQNGGLVHVDNGEVRASYTTAEGLGAGRVNSLRFDRRGALWAATAGGLSRLHNGRLATLTIRNGLPCDAVHWDIEDDAQAVWLYMPCGMVRIPVSDLHAWAVDADTDRQQMRPLRATLFDSSDGVTTLAIPYSSTPTVVKAVDGRIWFASAAGIGVIDPRRIPFNPLPPPVQIEQVVGDRIPYRPTADGRINLPALTRDLQIDYTALSFVAPEKLRFRYRLEGYDRDWQDVGNRRQAFYTNLPPRDYRFRVIAANNSGVWNEAGASVDFHVARAYYQTTWFLALSLGTVIALIWSAHRVRLRIVETHQREISALNERLMKAQEQERIRIAGELHDGVMQEMLAVTMMLGTAKRRIPDGSDARATIDKIQAKMIRVGTDLRRVSHDLHPPALQKSGLPAALQAYCDEFVAGSGIPVTCEVDEAVGDLSRGAALALFRIAQEALGNAARHAAAKRITVLLKRSGDLVSLDVSDDGVGFDFSRLGASGGLGLITMRERAGQLNGTFDFESAPGRGTTIRVMIPFRGSSGDRA
jgi:signal transduction histidine kinase/ligand-binding sensor domain-containing protein